MNSNDAIGGYFSLELNDLGSVYHDYGFQLNSGRNALYFILSSLAAKKVHIPYYACDSILEPIISLSLSYSFYYLDNFLLPQNNFELHEGEYLLYINYFGLCNNNVKQVIETYENVIIDNSQAFYDSHHDNIPTFYSPRKFFGVPDGGIAYCEDKKAVYPHLNTDISVNGFNHLIERIDYSAEEGYESFKRNDEALKAKSVKKMSDVTFSLMRNIDFPKIKSIRKNNFNYLHTHLKQKNDLTKLIEQSATNAPLAYPYIPPVSQNTREFLRQNRVYTAQYWPNVKKWLPNQKNTLEAYLVEFLIPLPIDQRLNSEQLDFIIQLINE